MFHWPIGDHYSDRRSSHTRCCKLEPKLSRNCSVRCVSGFDSILNVENRPPLGRATEAAGQPREGAEILAERGYPQDVIYAIKSHADYLEDCPRVSKMDKTLYACDELCGFITACAIFFCNIFFCCNMALILMAGNQATIDNQTLQTMMVPFERSFLYGWLLPIPNNNPASERPCAALPML